MTSIAASPSRAFTGIECVICDRYAEARLVVIGAAVYRRAGGSRSIATMLRDFMTGLHARHLAGLSIEVAS